MTKNIKDFFKIEVEKEKYIFLSACMDNVDQIVDSCVNYFFNEENMFAYFNALEENDIFKPTTENYVSLFRNIEYFIDDDISSTRKDKIGKLGEYFLSVILLDYFSADCVIPKLILITDNNMPIYGIDTLFYSPERDLLMFGESKFTDSVNNGISLLNVSLSEYEKQFNDEYRLIVNNRAFEKSKNQFVKQFAGPSNLATSFKNFVSKAGLKTLGIPLFVCHGEETDKREIFGAFSKKLRFREVISGMAIKYIIVSLPIKNKNEFVTILKGRLIEKKKWYERLSR